MRSIRSKLIVFSAASATTTLAVLFIVGYILLQGRLVSGLDELNEAEFRSLEAHLGPEFPHLTPRRIDDRIRETTDAAAALFYINVDYPKSGMVFYSRNLKGQAIPDVKGKRRYTSFMPNVGPLRVGEYVIKPFDITVATPYAPVRAAMRSYIEVCAALLVAMLAASVGIGVALSRLILRPLANISDTANRISSDNLSQRIPESPVDDELSALAKLLNRMFDRIETSFKQVKQFAGDASHELKTPLSLIRLHAEKLLADNALSPAQADAVVIQLQELDRLNQIIDELLFLSRAEAKAIHIRHERIDPYPALDRFAQDATVLADHHGVRFALSCHGHGQCNFEERWLRQVWLNLLTNALNVAPKGSTIAMSSQIDETSWQIVIEDEGPGLPPDQLRRVFERFVRFGNSVDQNSGSGLGLAIADSIVALHSGRIKAENRSDRSGLRVTIILPCGANE